MRPKGQPQLSERRNGTSRNKQTALHSALQNDPSLAERFYRSLSWMLSQRSRTNCSLAPAPRSQGAEREGDEGDELDLTQREESTVLPAF